MPRPDGSTLSKFGERPFTVALEVRKDESMRLRWYIGRTKQRMTLPSLKHKNPSGEVRVHDLHEAQRLALRASQLLQEGSDPRDAVEPAVRVPDVSVLTATSLGVLAMEFLDSRCGGISTDSIVNYRSLLQDARVVLGDAYDLDMLGEETHAPLVRGLAELWKQRRQLLDVSLELLKKTPEVAKAVIAESRRGGPVAAEKAVSLMYTLAQWASRQRKLRPPPALAKDWREKIANLWTEEVGTRHIVNRPRHKPKEGQSMVRSLSMADERVRLWFATGYGARGGQVRLVMRNTVDLEADDATSGRFFVPGGGRKKPGQWIDLGGRSVAAFRRAFSTWLLPFEDAYIGGLLSNYWIYPEGEFGWSDLTLDEMRSIGPISEDYLGTLYDRFELATGVEKIEGRRWYGHRRLFKTLTQKYEKDRRVLDRLMGHHTGGTGAIYEDHDEPSVRARAMEVRDLVWDELNSNKEMPE